MTTIIQRIFFWIGKRTSMAPRWSRDPMQMKGTKKNCLLFHRWHGERSVSMENQKKKRWISWFIRVWGAFCVVALFCFTRSASFLIMKRNFFYSGGWKRKLRWKYLTHQKGNVWPILVAKKNPSNLMAPESRSKVFHLKWISFYAHVDRRFCSKVPPVGLIDWSRDVMRQPITCEACGKWIFVFFSKNRFLNFREFSKNKFINFREFF